VARIGGPKNPDIDQIIALQPELVLANQEENTAAAVEALTAAGIRVWLSFPQSIDDAIEEWLNGGTSVEIIAAGVDTIHGNITQEENARIDKTAGGDATIRLVGQSIALDGGIVSESGKLTIVLSLASPNSPSTKAIR